MTTTQNLSRPMRSSQSKLAIPSLRKWTIFSPKTTPPKKVFNPKAFEQKLLLPAGRKDSLLFPKATSSKDVFTIHGPKNYALVQNIRYIPSALATQPQSSATLGQTATPPSWRPQGQKTFFAVTPVIHRRAFEEFAENELVPTQASEGRIPGAFPMEPKYPVRTPRQPEHSEGNILARIRTSCAIAAKHIYNVTKHQTHRFRLNFARDEDLATRTRNRILNTFQGTAEITERFTQANTNVIVKSYRAAIQAADSFKRRFVELAPATSMGAPQTQTNPATRPRSRQPRLPRRSRRTFHTDIASGVRQIFDDIAQSSTYPALSELTTANVFAESTRAVPDRAQKYLTCDFLPTDMFPPFCRENALIYLKKQSQKKWDCGWGFFPKLRAKTITEIQENPSSPEHYVWVDDEDFPMCVSTAYRPKMRTDDPMVIDDEPVKDRFIWVNKHNQPVVFSLANGFGAHPPPEDLPLNSFTSFASLVGSSNVDKGKGKAVINQPAPQTQSVHSTVPVAESSSGTSDGQANEIIQQRAIQQEPTVQHTVPTTSVANTHSNISNGSGRDSYREPAQKLKQAERSSPFPDPVTLEPSGNATSEEMKLSMRRLSEELKGRWKPHLLRDKVMDGLSRRVLKAWNPNSLVPIKDSERQEEIERQIKMKEEEVKRQAQLLKEAEEVAKRAEKDRIAKENVRKAEEAEAQWLQYMGREKVPAGKILITHLPDEWQRKVWSVMSKPMTHEVATVSNGTKLTRRDFGKVLPQEGTTDDPMAWLNDEVIAAYLQLVINYGLEKTNHRRGQTPRFHAFNSFFYKNLSEHGPDGVKRWASRAKIGGRALLDVDTVFIPVNSGLHWTLIVVSPKRRVIEYFDSLSRGNVLTHSPHINNIRRWLAQELADDYVASEWTAKIVADGPQQNNSSDCGVFTITTAKMVMLGWDPRGAYQASHIPLQRKRILAELIQGSLGEGLEPVASRTVAWEME